MRKRKLLITIIIVFGLLLLIGCDSTGGSNGETNSDSNMYNNQTSEDNDTDEG